MKKIGMIADEAADIPQNIREKYQIENIMFPVVFSAEEQETDLRGEAFYRKMREGQIFPTTSFPPPIRFKRAYQQSLESFEEVLVVVISSTLSGAFNTAVSAKSLLPEADRKRIHVFDSFAASGAQGLISLRAQELIEEGGDIPAILEDLNCFKTKVKLLGMGEDVKWLKAGGRISANQARILQLLKKIGINPILGLKEGKVASAGFFFLKDEVKVLLGCIKKTVEKTSGLKTVISYSDNISKALELKEGIEEMGAEVLYVTVSSPVIGAHIGPGTIIVSYCS